MNIILPSSWQELTDAQLEYVLYLLANDYDADTLRAYCFVRFSGIDPQKTDPVQVAELLPVLDFLTVPPDVPVRPETVGKRCKARYDTECRGMTFDTWLALCNWHTGFLHTRRPDTAQAMAELLYEGSDPLASVAAVWWFTGLKAQVARRFPKLFRSAGVPARDKDTASEETCAPGDTCAPDAQTLQRLMDVQIRALTGGDVTKTQAVLKTDYLYCLTELNAKAGEAEEMQKIMKR